MADPDRSYASEATYFWRYATERQLYELFERVFDVVLTNPLDGVSLNALLHDAAARTKREVRPLPVAFYDPLGMGMRTRGKVTESVLWSSWTGSPCGVLPIVQYQRYHETRDRAPRRA